MVGSRDVIEIADLLQTSGIEVWLDGGWGVDALLGEQTRPRKDVDSIRRRAHGT
jgi:lincosamide nucleotidyltransferase A/C/D/E